MNDAGYLREIAELTDRLATERAAREAAEALVAELREALDEYGQHFSRCPLARYEGGRPAAGGGYEQCFAGVWYDVACPPACSCGLSAILAEQPEDAALAERDARVRRDERERCRVACVELIECGGTAEECEAAIRSLPDAPPTAAGEERA